jgi:hypothetical protein
VRSNAWSGRRRHRRLRGGLFVLAGAALLAGLSAESVAAATTVNLDQWASTDLAWQNGNLNGNNSRYPEGGIVPFRLAMEGLSVGTHTIHLDFDVTAGGHKAYDFLATWNVTNAKGKICIPSGGAISSMCPSLPASSSMAFPTDPFVMDGLSVTGAQAYSAAPRRLTIWGGTILSISAVTHAGPVGGNSTGDMTVRFHASRSAVLLAWGGHLAQSAYWNRSNGGPSDGASMVSGSPWHMRTLQLDGTGNKNQDRSIQPSAIVGELPPFALAPPTPAPRATPRPATPGGGGGGGSGGGGGAGPGAPAIGPSYPTATLPPTSTTTPPAAEAAATWIPTMLALVAIGLLAMVPALRRRRR